MKENKKIKIGLGTAICIFIIVLLIIALAGVYYFGFIKNNEKIEVINNEKIALEKEITTLEQDNNLGTEETNVNVSSTSENVTYKDIVGVYTGKIILNETDSEGNKFSDGYCLTLYENGTYKYEHGVAAAGGTIGNYIIENDSIILNKWFKTSSDTSAVATNGKIELTLNKDGSIIDFNEATKVTLKKIKTNIEVDEVNQLIHGEGLGNEHGFVKE